MSLPAVRYTAPMLPLGNIQEKQTDSDYNLILNDENKQARSLQFKLKSSLEKEQEKTKGS